VLLIDVCFAVEKGQAVPNAMTLIYMSPPLSFGECGVFHPHDCIHISLGKDWILTTEQMKERDATNGPCSLRLKNGACFLGRVNRIQSVAQ